VPQGFPDPAVVVFGVVPDFTGGDGAKEVVGAGRGAVHENEPGALWVGDRGQPVEENLFILESGV